MPNGEPAYTVIMIEKEERSRLKGYAYIKMSATEYIKSLPMKYQQWIDPAVHPNQIPNHISRGPAKKKKTQRKRDKLLNLMSQEKGFSSEKARFGFQADT